MQLGLYQHYNGNYYHVMSVARHTETLDEMVVYRSLYGDYGVWVRPKKMFEEIITKNEQSMPRFKFIKAMDL